MPAPDSQPAVAKPLDEVFALVEKDLERVRQRIGELTSSQVEIMDDCFSYLLGRPGKMIRSVLLLLTAKAVGGPIDQRHIDYAAMIEIIHTATLLHDDVIDQATLRRGQASANALWGNTAAVLMGDYLLSRAFAAGVRHKEYAANEMLTETARQICQGELLQNLQSGNWNLTESQYMQIIDGKTAALFACSAALGALFSAAAPSLVTACRQFGVIFGRTFQITDDVMDVLGTDRDLGKTAGTDLLNRKLTLPLIHWLSALEEPQRAKAIGQLKTDPPHQWVLEQLEAAGSLGYAQQVLSDCNRQAEQTLLPLPPSRAKSGLLRLHSLIQERI